MNRWGGYAVHREPTATHATLTLHGQVVGQVHLDPDGGHHRYDFTGPDTARAFLLFAERMSPDALEPDDVLIDRLVVVDDLNRSRSVVFVTDADDFFDGGGYRTYGPNVPFEDVVALLSGAHRPGGDVIPLVWVPARSEFVPVTELADSGSSVA